MRGVQSNVHPLVDAYTDMFTELKDQTEVDAFTHSQNERQRFAVILGEADDYLIAGP